METSPVDKHQQNYTKARRVSLVFVAVIAIILVAMLWGILSTPYDSGVLAGAALSGNNQYGGKVVASNDYLFYVQEGKVIQQSKEDGQAKVIYEGDASHLNPYDGWLYFLEAGTIQRIAYYGGQAVQIGTADQVTLMSVNGLWIYYLQQDGTIGKVRSDGQEQRAITDGSIAFTAFESANRILLATDGKNIYQMKTDGADCKVLVKGTNITRMIYTLDNLFYCDDGRIKLIKSVEAGQDDGTTFDGVSAELFTYDVDHENRNQLIYVKDGQLWARKLRSIVHDKEEEFLLGTVTDIVDLYCVNGDLYYHDAVGNLYHMYLSETEQGFETETRVVE